MLKYNLEIQIEIMKLIFHCKTKKIKKIVDYQNEFSQLSPREDIKFSMRHVAITIGKAKSFNKLIFQIFCVT